MTDSTDRLWNIRDAVLKWLLLKAKLDRDRCPVLDAADVADTFWCQGGPMTIEEIELESDWLAEEGYIRVSGTYGHGDGRRRLSMTAKGEAYASSGTTVRGGTRAG